VFLLKMRDLAPLLFDFPLLVGDPTLGTRFLNLVVLQRVADQETTARTQYTAEGGADPWRTGRRANDRAGSRTQTAAREGALFASRQRLPTASDCSRQH
jgi:hypothetical protein